MTRPPTLRGVLLSAPPPVVQRVKSAVLTAVRSGPRTVLWHGGALGFANHLYLWRAAWTAQQEGRDVRVLADPRMAPWLERFPRLAGLGIARADVRLRDRRTLHDQQVFDLDYDAADLERFVRACLLPDLPAPAAQDPGALTLNVRRGDYYAVEAFRRAYGIDTVRYAETALARAEEVGGPVTDLLVVSDDPAWCRAHLGHLGRGIRFAPPDRPFEHFALVAGSRRLVLTNSTFSYWGAYVSNVRYADNHAQVVAPWFHRRDIDDGRAWQLDPRWTVVRDLPGGWSE